MCFLWCHSYSGTNHVPLQGSSVFFVPEMLPLICCAAGCWPGWGALGSPGPGSASRPGRWGGWRPGGVRVDPGGQQRRKVGSDWWCFCSASGGSAHADKQEVIVGSALQFSSNMGFYFIPAIIEWDFIFVKHPNMFESEPPSVPLFRGGQCFKWKTICAGTSFIHLLAC